MPRAIPSLLSWIMPANSAFVCTLSTRISYRITYHTELSVHVPQKFSPTLDFLRLSVLWPRAVRNKQIDIQADTVQCVKMPTEIRDNPRAKLNSNVYW